MSSINIIERIYEYAVKHGDAIALANPLSNPSEMTYRELFLSAVNLAEYLHSNIHDRNPIVVYGHKNPYMIVSFIACILSGHAYCPVDVSVPNTRIDMILDQTKSSIVLATEEFHTERLDSLKIDEIIKICSKKTETIPKILKNRVKGDETYYIIFTSGSTGTPKGVEISSNALDNFLSWSSTLGEEYPYGIGTIFLNQAHFSFDLSVMDLYTSLYCGCTLCMMEKRIQTNFAGITPFIIENNITAFVSTPSFMDMCLLDRDFNAEKIPALTSFFFCGEILANSTASKLTHRFPNAVIQNTYGPTESTVAVSSIRITKEVLEKYDPLPIGYAKAQTHFIISDNESFVENGRKVGEILITGNTLAKGYFARGDLTKKSFIQYDDGKQIVRAYCTGDLGYMDNGLLFYKGRIDLQIKLNGYRIEIGDIESSILKSELVTACVVIPRIRNGKVKSLVGVIVLSDRNMDIMIARELIRKGLEQSLPFYMIPQSYTFLDSIPMNNNGKADRKKLSVILEED